MIKCRISKKRKREGRFAVQSGSGMENISRLDIKQSAAAELVLMQ